MTYYLSYTVLFNYKLIAELHISAHRQLCSSGRSEIFLKPIFFLVKSTAISNRFIWVPRNKKKQVKFWNENIFIYPFN